MLLKPPLVKLMARSGSTPSVDPTAVTNGHADGKTGMNVLFVHWSGESWPPRTPYRALVEKQTRQGDVRTPSPDA